MQSDSPGDNSNPSGSRTGPHRPQETEWHGDKAGNFSFSRRSLINGLDVAMLARFALEVVHSAWVSKEFRFALPAVCMQMYEPRQMHSVTKYLTNSPLFLSCDYENVLIWRHFSTLQFCRFIQTSVFYFFRTRDGSVS